MKRAAILSFDKFPAYLHIGNNINIRTSEIIGIFDLDTSTVSPETRKFLRESEKNGKVSSAAEALPKSFVLTDERIWFSTLSPSALHGRVEKN